MDKSVPSKQFCNMMLDPRVTEYVLKKELYEKSGVKPELSLEKQFNITPMEFLKIKELKKWRFLNQTSQKNDVCYKLLQKEQQEKPLKFVTTNFATDCKIMSCDKQSLKQPGFWCTDGTVNRRDIDEESELKFGKYITLTGMSRDSCLDDFHYNNPNTKCDDDKILNTAAYVPVPYMGYGVGQGDINTDSALQFGEATRTNRLKAGETYIDRFDYLYNNPQDPDHIVMPWPRGGVDTRFMDKYSRRAINKYTK